MIHPRLNGRWLAEIGPYGAWGDLSFTTRWGQGACGVTEASWTMPLPAGFSSDLLKRAVLVDLMYGAERLGSSLSVSVVEPGDLSSPWTITAEGVGLLVQGQSSFYAFDSGGDSTTTASVAVDQAIARGLPWAGRDASVPTSAFGDPGDPVTVGDLLGSVADASGNRWGVDNRNVVALMPDPVSPTYMTTPRQVTLGAEDDSYATVVYVRYTDDVSGLNETVSAPPSASPTEQEFGRQEYLVRLTSPTYPAMSAATAQGYADGILAKAKGRLAFTTKLTLSSDELLTMGGRCSDLTLVRAGQMLRVHGTSNQLLSYNGQQWIDVVIGETRYVDGASTIDISPLGLAPRDLASVIEAVTGYSVAA